VGFCGRYSFNKIAAPQNKVLRTTGKFPSRTWVRELHKAFSIPYINDYITKLSRQQAEVKIMKMQCSQHWIRLKLGGGQAYNRSSD
jgi:hypothetical protein